MDSKYNIFVYQIIQLVIIVAFGMFGVITYIRTNPGQAFACLLMGYFASFIYTVVCLSLPSDNKFIGWMFKEW
jgi:hypothetical protein